MPLAEYGGFVALRLKDLTHRGETGIETARAWSVSAKDFCAARIASAEQRRARGRADGLRNVEIIEAASLAGELLHVRRGIGGMSEGLEIRPS